MSETSATQVDTHLMSCTPLSKGPQTPSWRGPPGLPPDSFKTESPPVAPRVLGVTQDGPRFVVKGSYVETVHLIGS